MIDEQTPEAAPCPVLEPHEADAIFAVLVRIIRCDAANAEDRKVVEELQTRIDARLEGRKKLIAAVDAFGFDVNSPEIWTSVKKSLGVDRYREAFRIAFPEANSSPNTSGKDTSQSESNGNSGESADRSEFQVPTISDAILKYLRTVHNRGSTVAEIKKHLRDVYGIETHEKTPGMTLYRLSKEGLARREGRTWFPTETVPSAESDTTPQSVQEVE